MSDFDQEIFEAKKDLFFEVLERIQAEDAKETHPKLFAEAIELTSKLWDFLTASTITLQLKVDAKEAVDDLLQTEIKLPLAEKKPEPIEVKLEPPLGGLTGRQQAVLDDLRERQATGQSTRIPPMVDTLKLTPKEIRIELDKLKEIGLVEQNADTWHAV